MLCVLFIWLLSVYADLGCGTFGNVSSVFPSNLQTSAEDFAYDSSTGNIISSARQYLLVASYKSVNFSIRVNENLNSNEDSKLAIGDGKLFVAFYENMIKLFSFDLQPDGAIVRSLIQPDIGKVLGSLYQIHYYDERIYIFTGRSSNTTHTFFVQAYDTNNWPQRLYSVPICSFPYYPFNKSIPLWRSVVDANGILSLRVYNEIIVFDLKKQDVVLNSTFDTLGLSYQPALLIPQSDGSNQVVFALGTGFASVIYPTSNVSAASVQMLNYSISDGFHPDYTSCSYSSSLLYVFCLSQSSQDGIDVYFAKDMRFTRSYVVDKEIGASRSLCALDQSRNLLLCTSGNTSLVRIAMIDFSGEICAPEVPASSVTLPQGTCINRTSSFCVPCPPGRYVTEEKLQRNLDLNVRVCLPCPLGQNSSKLGASRCAACPNNTFSASLGATECRECPVGSEMKNPTIVNVNDCICSAGFEFSNMQDGLIVCKLCDVNEYKNASGTCVACPGNSIALQKTCQCKAAFYQDPNLVEPSCLQCPEEGADCEDNELRLKDGYWRSKVAGKPILCSFAPSCPEGIDYTVANGSAKMNSNRCAEGYEGLLCGVCAAGWAKDSSLQSCVPCSRPSASYWVSAFALGSIFVPYYVIFASARNNRESADFMGVSLVLFYIQLLAQLSVPLPSNPWLAALDFSSVTPVPGCVAPISASQQWVLMSFGYPCWLLAVVLLSLLWVGLVKRGGDLLLRMAFSMIAVTDLLFISHTKHLFNVFPVREVDGVNFMLMDPSLACPGSECDADRTWAVFCLVCMFLGLSLLKMLLVPGSDRCGKFGLLERCRARIKKRVNLQFYSGAFTNKNPWWEAVWTIRRATVVTIASLTKEKRLHSFRSAFLAMAMAGWLAIHLTARPHGARLLKTGEPQIEPRVYQEYLNNVEAAILATLCTSFFLEVFVYLDFGTPDQISMIILFVNLPCIAYLGCKVVATYFVQLWRKAQDKLSLARANNLPITGPDNDIRAPRGRSVSRFRDEGEVAHVVTLSPHAESMEMEEKVSMR